MPDTSPPLLLYSATANCGNDGLGSNAVDHFSTIINEKKPDALVINIQEGRFSEIKAELEAMPQLQNYHVTQVGGMNTATDVWEATRYLWPNLKGPSGIGTFIIHKPDISVNVLDTQKVRALKHQWFPPGNYSKGGQIARVALTPKDTEATVIDVVSAHYESFDVVQRARDHNNVYLAHKHLLNNQWQKNKKQLPKDAPIKDQITALSQALPNQIFSGADTNVRNIYIDLNTTQNMWQQDEAPELMGLKKLPLANAQFSVANTFHQIGKKSQKDRKRTGFRGEPLSTVGSLDINAYLQFQEASEELHTTSEVIDVELSPDAIHNKTKGRDHVIVGSDNLIPTPLTSSDEEAFKKITFFIACRLKNIRPQLAKTIHELTNSDQNKQFILEIFELYFSSPHGVIERLMEQHQTYLKEIKKLIDNEKTTYLKDELYNYALKKIKPLWEEPLTYEYENLVNFQNLSMTKKNILLGLIQKNKFQSDVVSPFHIPDQVFNHLKHQVGQYHRSLEQVRKHPGKDNSRQKVLANDVQNLSQFINETHSEKSKACLYEGIQAYKEKQKIQVAKYTNNLHSKENFVQPNFFRRKFIQYLQEESLRNASTAQEKSRLSSPRSGATSMKNFLSKKGIKLFKLAMEEELNSTEYRDAVYFNSATHIEGEKWKQRPIHFIAGPASSGKTYSAQKLIPNILQELEVDTSKDGPGNLMIQVDGGIIRKTSQIRKLLVQTALSHGFTGVKDLQRYMPKGFSQLKEKIHSTALSSKEKVGITFPETFAYAIPLKLSPKDIEMVKHASEQTDTKVFFSRIKEHTTRQMSYFEKRTKARKHREQVKFSGERRAYKSSGFGDKVIIDLNNTDIEESKDYKKSSYDAGYINSRLMEDLIQEAIPSACIMHIQDDREIVQYADGVRQPYITSERVIKAWEETIGKVIPPRGKKLPSTLKKHLFEGGELLDNDLACLPFDTMAMSELCMIYRYNAPSLPTPPSLEGFNDFLHKIMQSPAPVVEIIQSGKPAASDDMIQSPLQTLDKASKTKTKNTPPKPVASKPASPTVVAPPPLAKATPKQHPVPLPRHMPHTSPKQKPSPGFFQGPIKANQLKQEISKKLNKDIFDEDLFSQNLIANKMHADVFYKKLNELCNIGNLLLDGANKGRHLSKIDGVISNLQKNQRAIESDINEIKKVLHTPPPQLPQDVMDNLHSKIFVLGAELDKYKNIILGLTNIHQVIKESSGTQPSNNLSLSNVTTTIINKDELSTVLGISKPLMDSAKLEVKPLQSLKTIPKGKVALHQFTYKKESLAFIESESHGELKAVKPTMKVSKPAKMQLAFMMAQKFVMNFDGTPTPNNPIYLKGKDIELIEMIHGSLQIMAGVDALNFDINAIKISNLKYKPVFEPNSQSLTMVSKIKNNIDHALLENIKSLSKSVHTFKSNIKNHDPIDEITNELQGITYP